MYVRMRLIASVLRAYTINKLLTNKLKIKL